MDKYKYQLLVIALTLCIGGVIGYFLSTNHSDTEIHKLAEERIRILEKENAVGLQHIDSLNRALLKRDSLSRADSLKVRSLEQQILNERAETKKKLGLIKKLTPNEKRDRLIDRYRTK